ncbi:MAG: tetratricopeptide repeat protein, partial [Planctomycetota bacterium]
ALWRQSTSAAVNRLMGKAISAYEDGDYDSAMDKFDMCRRLDPSVPELHRLRGEVLFSHANVRQAMSACERAIELNPHNFMAHYLRARIHMRQSNFEPALEAARDVLDIYPNHSAAAELESEILALQEATED